MPLTPLSEARGRVASSVAVRTGPTRHRSLTARRSSLLGLSVPTPVFELQSHSVFSDGELEPHRVVAAAAEAGVEILALSDHDSVEGVPAALAAGVAHGIRCLPAVEISTSDPQGADLHILGYLLDVADPALQSRLTRSRGDRELRAERMVEAVRSLGYAVDEAQLEARVAAGKTVGRPHLAQAVVTHPDNAERLAREGLAEPSRFLVAYLIEGKPGFAPRDAPTVAEAIDLIHGAGGLAVWAHPFWDIAEPAAVLSALDRFVGIGLDGVEAFYVTHNEEQTGLLVERCAERDLLTTGSSDFHGPTHREFNRFRAFRTFGLKPNLGPIAGGG